MSYLIYCILARKDMIDFSLPEGMDGKPVKLIRNNQLLAVVSKLHTLKKDTRSQMLFERVVERFFKPLTVIPVRFGCILESKEKVASYLSTHEKIYRALMTQFKGCFQMGIRVLCPIEKKERTTHKCLVDNYSPTTGKAYLWNRKFDYDRKCTLEEKQRIIFDHYKKAFKGLYRAFKLERMSLTPHHFQTPYAFLYEKPIEEKVQQPTVFSFYFLIRKDAETLFRQQFENVSRRHHINGMISGPWPPYNFVTGQ